MVKSLALVVSDLRKAVEAIPCGERVGAEWEQLMSNLTSFEDLTTTFSMGQRQHLVTTNLSEQAKQELADDIDAKARRITSIKSTVDSVWTAARQLESKLEGDKLSVPAEIEDDTREKLVNTVALLEKLEERVLSTEDYVLELEGRREGIQRCLAIEQEKANGLEKLLREERQRSAESRTKEDRWKSEVAARLGRLGEEVKSQRSAQSDLKNQLEEAETNDPAEVKKYQAFIATKDALSRRIMYGGAASKELEDELQRLTRLRTETARLRTVSENTAHPVIKANLRAQAWQDIIHSYENRLAFSIKARDDIQESLAGLSAHQKLLLDEVQRLEDAVSFLELLTSHQQHDACARESNLKTRYATVRDYNQTAM